MSDLKEDPWVVYCYEVYMLLYTKYLCTIHAKNADTPDDKAQPNAVLESRLLHIRILTEIFISINQPPDYDNILLEHLVPEDQQTKRLKSLIKDLKDVYGRRDDKGKPRWTLNKMLAHPSRTRSSSYDYQSVLNAMEPVLYGIIMTIQKIKVDKEIGSHLSFASNNQGSVVSGTH